MSTFKLPPDFKIKWLEALRSGKFKHGKFRLYNPLDDAYCCLGVAGILAGLSKEDMKRAYGLCNLKNEISPRQYDETVGTLPQIIVMSAPGDLVVGTLTDLNDHQDSYDKVIAYIENEL